jgi:hypothetical protein
VKREDEFVKRFWSVSDIFAGTVAIEREFHRVSVVVDLEGGKTWPGFGGAARREGLWRWIRWLAASRAGLSLTLERDLTQKAEKKVGKRNSCE